MKWTGMAAALALRQRDRVGVAAQCWRALASKSGRWRGDGAGISGGHRSLPLRRQTTTSRRTRYTHCGIGSAMPHALAHFLAVPHQHKAAALCAPCAGSSKRSFTRIARDVGCKSFCVRSRLLRRSRHGAAPPLPRRRAGAPCCRNGLRTAHWRKTSLLRTRRDNAHICRVVSGAHTGMRRGAAHAAISRMATWAFAHAPSRLPHTASIPYAVACLVFLLSAVVNGMFRC